MSAKSKLTLLSVSIPFALFLSACGEGSSSSSGADFNQTSNTSTSFNQLALIESLSDNVIAPTYQAFLVQSEQQSQAIAQYCLQETQLGNANATIEQVQQQKVIAKQSWRDAMNIWQQAEMMQIGPLSNNDSQLRNKIYSWPSVNDYTCGVDLDVTFFKQGVVNGAPYDISLRLASRKGLTALEYLLFNDNVNHSCLASSGPESWDNQTEQYRKIARCEFASEVAVDVNNNAQLLVDAWQGAQGYGEKLKQAGTTGSEFDTEHQAVNLISDALFYLDLFTKDGKIAEPLGLLNNECGSQACPEIVESALSANSLNNIINNLLGFEKFLNGDNKGIGFIDYLVDVGDQDTANSLTANVQQAISATQAYEFSLGETLTTAPEQVEQTHDQVKAITDQLKADFITSLALELPQTAAGDND
jgi:predicted lipoprotein